VKREDRKWSKQFANDSNIRKRAPCLKKPPQRSIKSAQQPCSEFCTTRKNLHISYIIIGALGFLLDFSLFEYFAMHYYSVFTTICRDEQDEWVWRDNNSEMYTVKLAYKKLNNKLMGKELKSIKTFGT